jgi:uncharacterized protein (UPF0216 family)
MSQLEREVAELNNHLPRTKKSLEQLLVERNPAFITRDGQVSAIRREELEELAELVPPMFHSVVMVPFTILRRTSLGPGAHTIGGTKLEQFTVLRIIHKVSATYEVWREITLPKCIYSPEVSLLRRKLPTTTAIGFSV